MNERVQLRYCVVDCLKHDISSQGVKSVCKVQFHKDLVPRHAVMKLLAACTAASQPPAVAMPIWRGAKKDSSLVTANLFAHFAASRLQMYPIAIGLSPPDFLDKAMRVPPNIISRISGGHSPRSSTFMKPVSAWMRVSDDSRLFSKSSRSWGRIPSGPPEDPAGKDRITSRTSLSVTWNGAVWATTGKSARLAAQLSFGCLSCIAAKDSCVCIIIIIIIT